MKYLFLDVKNNSIKMVDANTLEDYYNLIGCRTIDIVTRTIGSVTVNIVVDDEGALVDNPKMSAIGLDGQPMLFGNLLVASGRVIDGELTELKDEEIDEITDYIGIIRTSTNKEPYPVILCDY